jgi:hypothetical protein
MNDGTAIDVVDCCGKTTTLIAALRFDRIDAPMTIDGDSSSIVASLSSNSAK